MNNKDKYTFKLYLGNDRHFYNLLAMFYSFWF
ncbi:hypothetical protein NEOC65_002484 [Neochlamydia sp. AcF65]|nr:hypothetical protein [Neochlamydia sp. AcF65]MBS4169632.1 hypothetical protein [Neochlamydia sp. AcF95]